MIDGRVNKIYATRRERAERMAMDRRREVYAEHPELEEIDRAIAEQGWRNMRTILRGLSPHSSADGTEGDGRDGMSSWKELFRRRGEYMRELGVEDDFDQPRYECPRCKDTGFVNGLQRCECHRMTLASISLFPEEESSFSGGDFDHPDLARFPDAPVDERGYGPRQYMQAARKCLKAIGSHFDNPSYKDALLMGGTGTGKTYLAGTFGNALRRAGHLVVFVPWTRYLGELRNLRRLEMNFNAAPDLLDRQRQIVEDMERAELLILDDVGAGLRATEDEMDEMMRILNLRRDPGRRTLITTNLLREDLISYYGERIVSRMMQRFTFIPLTGPDQRTTWRRER